MKYWNTGSLIKHNLRFPLPRIKKAWIASSLPLKTDDKIIIKLDKTKKTFENKKIVVEASKAHYVETTKKTTLDLAPQNWEYHLR